MTISHIFFDLHGTLVDSARLSAGYGQGLGRVMAERFGGKPDAWAQAHRRIVSDWDSYFADLDFDGDDGLADLWEGEVRITRALFRITGVPEPEIKSLTALSRELPYLATHGWDAFYPDTKAVLERLHQAGFILGVASSVISGQARGLLEGAGVLNLFAEPFLCPDVTERFRKDAAFYHVAYLPPQNCLVVDDCLDGIAGAKAAGMGTVQICREHMPPYESPANHVLISGLSGLLNYLGIGT